MKRRDENVRLREAKRDRSYGAAIGRIEVNGNGGGNGVPYVRLVENRWPRISTPCLPPVPPLCIDTGLAVFSGRAASGGWNSQAQKKKSRKGGK